MEVTRVASASPYEAPLHHHMRALRLQGHEASGAEAFWVGLSHFLPGGGAERSAGPVERVYVVTEGTLTVVTDDSEADLGPYDSCRFAPGEARSIENRTNLPASAIVILTYPEGERP